MNRVLDVAALEAALADAPLHWATVKELWPDLQPGTKNWERTVPADVVVRALSAQERRHHENIRYQAARADRAERLVTKLVDAAQAVIASVPSTLFDEDGA